MFQKREAMADTLGVQQNGIVQVRIAWIFRASGVKQGFSCMEQERDVDLLFCTGLLECHKFLVVESNMIRPVFRANQVKPCRDTSARV